MKGTSMDKLGGLHACQRNIFPTFACLLAVLLILVGGVRGSHVNFHIQGILKVLKSVHWAWQCWSKASLWSKPCSDIHWPSVLSLCKGYKCHWSCHMAWK